jgi:hypothetical protein
MKQLADYLARAIVMSHKKEKDMKPQITKISNKPH